MSTIIFDTELAKKVGVNEAIIITKVGFWQKKLGREVFNSYAEWQLQFPWLSAMTVQRLFVKLEKLGYLTVRIEGSNKKFYQVAKGIAHQIDETPSQSDETAHQNDTKPHQIDDTSHQSDEENQATVLDTVYKENKQKKVDPKLWPEYEQWVQMWNKSRGQRRKPNDHDFKNWCYWRKQYDLLDMNMAVQMMRHDQYWADANIPPAVILRQFGKDKVTPADRFGDFLNTKVPGNIELESLRFRYTKLRTWFDKGQPVEEIAEVFTDLQRAGFEDLATTLAKQFKAEKDSNAS